MKTYDGKRLPIWREILYGGGNFTASMFGTIIGTWLAYFYVRVCGFDANAIAIAMIVYTIWNAVNDPLMGYVSDRTRTKWGRRLPYVLFGAIPLAVSFILIFSPPLGSLQTPFTQILYYTLSLCFYDFFFTTVLLNWEAVVPDMYSSEKDRSRIIGIAQILDILGGVVASVAVQPVFEKFGWSAMAVIFGILGGITMLMTVLGIRENPKHSIQKSLGLIESFKQTFKNKSFLIAVFAVLFVETARLLMLAMIPFYAEGVFPDQDGAATYISSIVFVSGLLFTPVALAISKKVGVKKAYIICLIAFAVVTALFITCNNFIYALVLSVLMGLGVTGGLIMPKLLNTEIIDEDQTVTGRRREGAFYGVYAFIIRFATALQTLALTAVITVTGYIEGQPVVGDKVVMGFRLGISIIPALMIVLGIVIIVFYPLQGARLDEVKAKIAQMEQAEEQALQQSVCSAEANDAQNQPQDDKTEE